MCIWDPSVHYVVHNTSVVPVSVCETVVSAAPVVKDVALVVFVAEYDETSPVALYSGENRSNIISVDVTCDGFLTRNQRNQENDEGRSAFIGSYRRLRVVKIHDEACDKVRTAWCAVPKKIFPSQIYQVDAFFL